MTKNIDFLLQRASGRDLWPNSASTFAEHRHLGAVIALLEVLPPEAAEPRDA